MTTPTDDDDLETEADRLREARQLAGLTQEQLALRTGMDKLSVSRHETGRGGISRTALPLYARELGVSEAWLRFGIGPGPRTAKIVSQYLETDEGQTTPKWVIPLLRRVSYRALGISRVTTGHVHRVRELIQLNRAVDPTMPKDARPPVSTPKRPRSRR